LQGEEAVDLKALSGGILLSPILDTYAEKPLALVYDSLTDLILSTGFQSAYNFSKNTLENLVEKAITALFLLNPNAHEPSQVHGIRNLFNAQLTYGKAGLTKVKLT